MADPTLIANGSASAGVEKYGGFWIRVLAYSADFSIVTLGLIGLAVPFVMLGHAGMAIYSALAAVAPFGYFAWLTASARQATFGKQLCGLKVVHAGTGARISFPQALIRELAKILSSALFFLGFIMVGFMGRKQGLHDVLAATVVVRDRPARVVAATLVSLAGIVIPLIVIPLLFAAFFAAMLALLLGGVPEEMRRMLPVPELRQPVEGTRAQAPPATIVHCPLTDAAAKEPAGAQCLRSLPQSSSSRA